MAEAFPLAGAFRRPGGTCVWLRDGELHRDDGPVVEHPGGTRYR